MKSTEGRDEWMNVGCLELRIGVSIYLRHLSTAASGNAKPMFAYLNDAYAYTYTHTYAGRTEQP
jgi:hypothetical protein